MAAEKSSLRHLILTHTLPDHIGSTAAIIAQTGATTYIGVADTSIARIGGPFRPMSPAPGLLNRLGLRLAMRSNGKVDPVEIDHDLHDGDELDAARGLNVINPRQLIGPDVRLSAEQD